MPPLECVATLVYLLWASLRKIFQHGLDTIHKADVTLRWYMVSIQIDLVHAFIQAQKLFVQSHTISWTAHWLRADTFNYLSRFTFSARKADSVFHVWKGYWNVFIARLFTKSRVPRSRLQRKDNYGLNPGSFLSYSAVCSVTTMRGGSLRKCCFLRTYPSHIDWSPQRSCAWVIYAGCNHFRYKNLA